ncbi:hypothetical protein BGX21_004124, partial [Mortierella sp. AD011]
TRLFFKTSRHQDMIYFRPQKSRNAADEAYSDILMISPQDLLESPESNHGLGLAYFKGNGVQKDDIRAMECFQKAADQGYAPALAFIGYMYEYGKGVPQSYSEAIEWYRKAASQGNVTAMHNLGVLYYDGKCIPPNFSEAFKWFSEAAGRGSASALNYIGVIYNNGKGVPQDHKIAKEYFSKAAIQGDTSAMNNLGAMYRDGKGVVQNYQEAMVWFHEAANQGNISAFNNIGCMYRNGDGVVQNYGEAMFWFQKAADRGFPAAQVALGDMYRDGQGVAQDYEKASAWFTKAAGRGYPAAQVALGDMCRGGHGVAQDDYEASEWYRKAALQGNTTAQNNLGIMYRNGDGLRQDRFKAIVWFLEAANSGNAEAQCNIGDIYREGKGVPLDKHKALEWYVKAAEQNLGRAQNRLREMYGLDQGCAREKWNTKTAALIAKHLDRQDLIRCLRVCKAWFNSFLILAWSAVSIRRSSSTRTSHQRPTLEVLQRHSHLVRDLRIKCSLLTDDVLKYSSLRSLSLEIQHQGDHCYSIVEDLTRMITLNPTLTSLTIDGLTGSHQGRLWKSVLNASHLTSITLQYGTIIGQHDVAAFWSSCTQLEELSFFNMKLQCGSGMVDGLIFPNMRNLHLEFAIDDGLEIEDQFYVIKHSPRLNCLTWLSEAADKAKSKEFGSLLKQGAWPHLKSLVLLIDMEDGDVALMLDGLNSPTNLGLAWSMFGPCAFKSIRRHLDTLRELDISGCSLVTGAMNREVLYSSPQLEVFKTGSILAKSVEGDAPWACLSLKSLRICFIFNEGDKDTQRMIFKRLSRLTRLRSIEVGDPGGEELQVGQVGLDFRLESGLNELQSLRQLRQVNVVGLGQSLEREDIQWMSNNWKSLVSIHGCILYPPEALQDLKFNFWIDFRRP